MTRLVILLVALVAAFLAGATVYRRARIDARLAALDEDTGFVPMAAWTFGPFGPDYCNCGTTEPCLYHPFHMPALHRTWRALPQ